MSVFYNYSDGQFVCGRFSFSQVTTMTIDAQRTFFQTRKTKDVILLKNLHFFLNVGLRQKNTVALFTF